MENVDDDIAPWATQDLALFTPPTRRELTHGVQRFPSGVEIQRETTQHAILLVSSFPHTHSWATHYPKRSSCWIRHFNFHL